jgi:hypothetical protein
MLARSMEADPSVAANVIEMAMAIIDAAYEMRGDLKPAGGAVKHELIERHRKTLTQRLTVVMNSHAREEDGQQPQLGAAAGGHLHQGDTGMSDFEEFPKMARLSRRVIISEKIDGTNAQILIGEDGSMQFGSRTRWITPEDDNYGFARWATENAEELRTLGAGRHFGEWWGCGIQRGYGLKEKRFSLFNSARWYEVDQYITDDEQAPVRFPAPACCHVVPVLFDGIWTPECAPTQSNACAPSAASLRPVS